MSRYLRNVEAIAEACGVKFPKGQRHRKAALLAPVKEWMARPDFPKKHKHGWLRAEVMAWHHQFSCGLAETLQPPEELPAQESPAADLFNLTPEEISASNKERLQRNLLVHLGKIPALTPLRKFEVDELVANRLIPPIENLGAPANGGGRTGIGGGATAISDVPKEAAGLTGIANALNRYYSGRVKCGIRRQDIKDWRAGQRLPVGAPIFPAPKDSNRFDTAECIAWFDRVLLPVHGVVMNGAAGGGGELFNFAELEALRSKNEKERLEHESWQREQERRALDADYAPKAQFLSWSSEWGLIVFKTIDRAEKTFVKELNQWLKNNPGAANETTNAERGTRNAELPGLVAKQLEALKAEIARGLLEMGKRVKESVR